MKTTLIRCVTAYAAVCGLMEQEWDYESAYALTQLRRALQGPVDFFLREEGKLVDRYGKKDRKGNVCLTERGGFLFWDPAQAGEYQEKRMELGGVETQAEWTPQTLPRPERIRPAQLEALEGFISFEGGGA
ncbi:hypothetical protein [uncultured Oscillibacter sp.]|uniref:hypothetical protein n=1 Tax=uncultured Oscillibacter sp. TaxID=876091 RepID=UPI00262C6E81|nr:hypothetical protein [uncultured Oscillibacter sp.]